MVARAFDPERWTVRYSTFQAYEVFGPGVSALLVVSTAATVLGLLVTVALFVRGFRNPDVTAVGLGLLVLATIAITTITNKTLSPQYLLWLGGPAAVLLLSRRTEGPGRHRVLEPARRPAPRARRAHPAHVPRPLQRPARRARRPSSSSPPS